jgi:hypothetical protein
MGQAGAMVKQMRDMNQWPSWKVPEAFFLDAIKTTGLI